MDIIKEVIDLSKKLNRKAYYAEGKEAEFCWMLAALGLGHAEDVLTGVTENVSISLVERLRRALDGKMGLILVKQEGGTKL